MKTKHKEQKLLYLHLAEPSIMVDGFEFTNFSKIKKIKKTSIDEIYIGDLLDYFDNESCSVILLEIMNKLKDGGKLYIQSFDAKCLASSLVYGNINTVAFKNLLFGASKKNIFTLNDLKGIIENSNIKITKCRFINAMQYYIECVKNA